MWVFIHSPADICDGENDSSWHQKSGPKLNQANNQIKKWLNSENTN